MTGKSDKATPHFTQTPAFKQSVDEAAKLAADINQLLGFRATPEFKQRVDDAAWRARISVSEWLRRAASAALSASPIEPTATPDALAQIMARLDSMEARFSQAASVQPTPAPVAAPEAEPVQLALEPDDYGAELAEVFSALCEKLGDSELEIQLSVPLQYSPHPIDIWVPEKRLAVVLAARLQGMTQEENGRLVVAIECFSPGAVVRAADRHSIDAIAAEALQLAPLPPAKAPAAEPNGEELKAKLKALFASPEFIAKYKRHGFKSRDLLACLELDANLSYTAFLRHELIRLSSAGIIERIPPAGKKAGHYILK